MNLVDAMCSNPNARSVVEYSLTPCYRRSYSTIFKAINEMELDDLAMARLLAPYLPRPRQLPFWVLGTDVTPRPRQFARTLPDRGMVYQPLHEGYVCEIVVGRFIRRFTRMLGCESR